MSQENNGLQLLKAEIKNFKNIDYREVDFGGRSVILTGSNQKGKSSFIQALMSPMDSSYIPIEPIKEGEEKGHVKLKIGGHLEGEAVEYKVECYFSQAKKRGRVVLFDKEGTQIKDGVRGILDGIIGNISFNIMSFIRMGQTETGKVSISGVREQIKILEGLMDRETLKAIYKLRNEYTEKYDSRTDINREIKLLQGQIDNSEFSQEQIELYSKKKSIAEENKKLEAAKNLNGFIDDANAFNLDYSINVNALDESIEKLKEMLAEKEKEKVDLEAKKIKVDTFLKKNPNKSDISALTDALQTISDHNTNCDKVEALHQVKTNLTSKTAEAEKISTRLTKIKEDESELFSNAKMPVKGLAFDEEKVTYKGLPLSEGNIPSSQLIGIGLMIGMALNPNLKLLVIKDGSLLDNKTMNYVLKTCSEKGYQLLIETVKHEGGELEVEFIEKEGK
ncbi:MAG: hypothetical protein ACTSRU_00775 [Candidatus Hodarchaeales archaeon]